MKKIHHNRSITQPRLHRQIYKGLNIEIFGSMTEEKNKWWLGLGEELEEDIETFIE